MNGWMERVREEREIKYCLNSANDSLTIILVVVNEHAHRRAVVPEVGKPLLLAEVDVEVFLWLVDVIIDDGDGADSGVLSTLKVYHGTAVIRAWSVVQGTQLRGQALRVAYYAHPLIEVACSRELDIDDIYGFMGDDLYRALIFG